MFQIARGSGATLSERTFFFEKAHVTKKTSPRQTTSRLQDKKNPNRAISEFLFEKEPGYMLGRPSTKNQSNFKTRPSSSLFQIARDSGATPRWEHFFFKKKYTPPEDLTKRYTVSLKKALGRRLILLGKT